MIPRRLAANCAAFVAAALFGGSVVAVRVAVQEVPPLSLAVLRFGQGGLLLVLLLLITRGSLRIEWRDLPLLAVLGAILFTVFPVTFNASLRLIEASRGALLVAAVLGAAHLAERLTIIFTIGFGAVLLGVLLVNWPRQTATAATFQSR